MPSEAQPPIQEMSNALNAFFAAATKDELRGVLEGHREALLSRVATLIVKGCMSQETKEARVKSLEVYLHCLEDARMYGIDAALKRLDHIPRAHGYIFHFEPKSGLR
jgi:hypothetical protein